MFLFIYSDCSNLQFSHLHFLLEGVVFCFLLLLLLCFDPLSLATIQLGIDQAERFQSIGQKEPVVQNWMSE